MPVGPRDKEASTLRVVGVVPVVGDGCSRGAALAARDEMRQIREEIRRCEKRQRYAGFEKIDSMRYGG